MNWYLIDKQVWRLECDWYSPLARIKAFHMCFHSKHFLERFSKPDKDKKCLRAWFRWIYDESLLQRVSEIVSYFKHPERATRDEFLYIMFF